MNPAGCGDWSETQELVEGRALASGVVDAPDRLVCMRFVEGTATHESVSGFVIRAAQAEAERVLARTDVTLMPAEQFDAMITSLDEPDPAPNLARAAARARRFQRT